MRRDPVTAVPRRAALPAAHAGEAARPARARRARVPARPAAHAAGGQLEAREVEVIVVAQLAGDYVTCRNLLPLAARDLGGRVCGALAPLASSLPVRCPRCRARVL